MKIQLDTTNKTVKIEENIKVSKLIATLKKLLPEDWKEFTLEAHTTINNWSFPYIIREYPVYPKPYYPNYPWYYSTTKGSSLTMSSGNMSASNKISADYSLKSGVYNVEC